MYKNKRILFTGASGSGTTTLGKKVASQINVPHFDLDDFFWKKTKIPFTEFRSQAELQELINKALFTQNTWIISGDPSEWGVGIADKLTHIYFLECPTNIRVQRLNEREFKKQGELILEGGQNYENHQSFIEWTKKYDEGGVSGRTRPKQEKWIASLNCQVYQFSTDQSVNTLVENILKTLNA